MKRSLLFLFLLLLLLGGVAGGLYWSSSQVPDFYQIALQEQSQPEVRQQKAKQFVQHSMQLVNDVRNKDRAGHRNSANNKSTPGWLKNYIRTTTNGFQRESLITGQV